MSSRTLITGQSSRVSPNQLEPNIHGAASELSTAPANTAHNVIDQAQKAEVDLSDASELKNLSHGITSHAFIPAVATNWDHYTTSFAHVKDDARTAIPWNHNGN